jgi:TRAP-type C4-dicarboxylate transport system permease large subunit
LFSHATLKKIGRKIKFSFYTPLTLLKIVRKLSLVGFFNIREIGSFIVASPLLIRNIISREIQKKRLGDSLRRIFINNR